MSSRIEIKGSLVLLIWSELLRELLELTIKAEEIAGKEIIIRTDNTEKGDKINITITIGGLVKNHQSSLRWTGDINRN